jgi:hypothetical protein
MNQAEAIERCRQQGSVKMNIAVVALGISRKTADKRRKIDGCIADGVPVTPVTERCSLVASSAILRVLEPHNFTVGPPPAAVLPSVKTGEGGLPPGAALANVQMP